MSFFSELECVGVDWFLRFSRKRQKTDLHQFIFQGLGENTSSQQPALENTAPGF